MDLFYLIQYRCNHESFAPQKLIVYGVGVGIVGESTEARIRFQ